MEERARKCYIKRKTHDKNKSAHTLKPAFCKLDLSDRGLKKKMLTEQLNIFSRAKKNSVLVIHVMFKD